MPPLAAAAAGVTVLLWASAFVVIRLVGTHLSPGPIALLRLAVAVVVLTRWCWPAVSWARHCCRAGGHLSSW